MEKQETIAGTMATLMASGPLVTEFPNYKALNDHVGMIHGLAEGKCQALAGEKAWRWYADTDTGKWRSATEAEFKAKQEAAAAKNSGGPRKAKTLSNEDRESLDAQVEALVAVANPALAGLLADLLARRDADDLARKGSLKDRLAAAIERLTLARVVDILEEAVAADDAAADAPVEE